MDTASASPAPVAPHAPEQPPTPMAKSGGMKKGLVALLIVVGVLAAGYLVYPYVAAILYFTDPFAPSGDKTYTNEQYGFSFTYHAGDFRVRKGTASDKGPADPMAVAVLEDRREGLGFGGGRTAYFEVFVLTESMDSIRSRYAEEVVERPITVAGQPAYEVVTIATSYRRDGTTFLSSRGIFIPYRGVVYVLSDREPALNVLDPILVTFQFTK